jgi:hypothetical protein
MAGKFAGPMGSSGSFPAQGVSVMDALGKLGIPTNKMPGGFPQMMTMPGMGTKQLQQALSLGRSAVGLQNMLNGKNAKTPLTADTYYQDPGKLASAVMAIWKQYNSDLGDSGQPAIGLPQFISQMPFGPEVKTLFGVLFGGAGGEQIFDPSYYQGQ